MRLNRVLLLAATINILIFALVFTISCSGEDGARGKQGEGCEIVKEGTLYKIVCNDDEVGELRGEGGKPGAKGPKGGKGPDGESCQIGPKTTKGYEVFCGSGISKGYLNGCAITTVGDFETIIACGTKAAVHLCGQSPFDPIEKVCDPTNGTLSANTVTFSDCGDQKNVVEDGKQYCGYGKNDKAGEPTVVYPICEGTLEPFKSAYDEEVYCRFYSEKESKVVNESVNSGLCDGKRINENSWKAQYCGYANNEATKLTLLTGACDSADLAGVQGPNESAFGKGYCEVPFENKLTGKTVYSEKLCGTSEYNKPNNGKWENEYCGRADSSANEATKVWKGLCDNSTATELKGPHLEKFNDGYCQVPFDDTKKMVIGQGKTVFSQMWCGLDGKYNEGSWQGQYCGYANATAKKAEKVYDGACDIDGEGPHANGWNPKEYCTVFADNKFATKLTEDRCDDGKPYNEDSWKGEYCGYDSKTAKTTKVMSGACDDGYGPNSDGFNGGYCTVKFKPGLKIKPGVKVGKTEYTTDVCDDEVATSVATNKINEGEWKGEYCGYKDITAVNNNKPTAQKGVCDDGKGPSAASNDKGFCEYVSEDATSSIYSENWCISGTGTTARKNSINKDSWQGQFCTIDGSVKACKGGLVPIEGVKNADANYCTTPALSNACKKVSGFAFSTNKKCEQKFSDSTTVKLACGTADNFSSAAGMSTTAGLPADAIVKADCITDAITSVCTTKLKGKITPAADRLGTTADSCTITGILPKYCQADTTSGNGAKEYGSVAYRGKVVGPATCEFIPFPASALKRFAAKKK